MPELYLFIVILLFVLAISDLIVGVSNDAVNFLNSAIGSSVASRNVIMIVASLGIFVGATFSSGMMEVARKGIFNPQFFFFAEIMVIFLAVMLTDIILLDLFNTFGMPTSTTVSIVFELLGAAVAVSVLKILAAGDGMDTLGQYINTSSAIAIISGIFLSVGIAFIIGALLQYLSRLLFTFEYKKRIPWVGALWGGVALTILTFFLIFKGAKGASFISDEVLGWIKANTALLIGISLVFWIIVMQILIVLKVNILRLIVLFGTFSLAMAFAGNDLVNFIGVPIAGFESYMAWSGSGEEAGQYSMEVLQRPVRTRTYMLLLAGLIMILTLWLSKKSRSVTETEVNLGRQSEGAERFSPNMLARGIVRYTRLMGAGFQRIIPNRLLRNTNNRLETVKPSDTAEDQAAFDLVRAAVNLTVASMLISFATSLKLPLSTTYVSFMVAMGTSLADRAWGRESAVYRVAGVLNVIGGWFGTAIIAFSVSATFAWLIFQFGVWAIGGLVIAAVFFISRTFLIHQRKERRKEAREAATGRRRMPAQELQAETATYIAGTLDQVRTLFRQSVEGLVTEDLRLLSDVSAQMQALEERHEDLKYRLVSSIQKVEEDDTEISRLYLLVYDLEQDLLQSVRLVTDACRDYVRNSLVPFSRGQQEQLRELTRAVERFLELVARALHTGHPDHAVQILQEKPGLLQHIEALLNDQVRGLRQRTYGNRNTMLFFSLQLETKDIVAVAARFVKLYRRHQEAEGVTNPLLFSR